MEAIFEKEVVKNVESVFKRCPLCGKVWKTAEEFLNDADLQLNGYQGNLFRLFEGREKIGLLLFTHQIDNCGTTLSFTADAFRLPKERTHPQGG